MAETDGCRVIAFIVILVGVIAVFIVYNESETSNRGGGRASRTYHEAQARQREKDLKECEQIVQEGLTKGFYHSVNVKANVARMDPALWSIFSIEQKQRAVLFLSRYFDLKGSTGRVTILSNRNDQKLATYSAWSGVKILQ